MTPEKLRGVAGLDRQEILGDASFSGSGSRVVGLSPASGEVESGYV